MRPIYEKRDLSSRTTAFPFAWAAILAIFAIGCNVQPPAPLWEGPPYAVVAVLPSRMVVSTGAPPFTTPDTDRSNRLADVMQQAAAAAMVQKGYDVLPPLDVNERLAADRALGERFMSLAAGFGMMPDASLPPDAMDRGLAEAQPLAEALGADLLVLVSGHGEYHSPGETILQGVLRGVLSKGREMYAAPDSALSTDVHFVDPARRTRIARIIAANMSYTENTVTAARQLFRQMARVPNGPKGPPAR